MDNILKFQSDPIFWPSLTIYNMPVVSIGQKIKHVVYLYNEAGLYQV